MFCVLKNSNHSSSSSSAASDFIEIPEDCGVQFCFNKFPLSRLSTVRIGSFSGFNNDTSLIITKPFDFSNNGGVNPQFSFYMYRDNGFGAQDDHIRVYVNTSPTLSGATLLSNTASTNLVISDQ